MTDAATIRLSRTALYAGLMAGALDMAAAVLLNLEYPARVIFQSVAAGWLGAAAFEGGWPTAWLGLASHFGIMLGFAVAWVVLAVRAEVARSRWVIAGTVWGIAVWGVMVFLVVPLSNATLPFPDLRGAVEGLLTHIVCIGWPMAWIARRMLGAPLPKA
jgi:hypothetical protein